MEVPLTPLDLARRTRRLYSDREAVVDGALRLTYEQFFDRCDRWSAALRSDGSAVDAAGSRPAHASTVLRPRSGRRRSAAAHLRAVLRSVRPVVRRAQIGWKCR